jgi:hypothetical protein
MSKYWKIDKVAFWIGLIIIIASMLIIFMTFCTMDFIMNKDGVRYSKGYDDGWNDANKGIINVLDKYDSVKLVWANGTQMGIELEKYYEPQLYFNSGLSDKLIIGERNE